MSDSEFIPRAVIDRSDEQRAIQLARERALIVEANAGAAKTTTLALRIAQALARGAARDHLLALTYTEPAVQALRAALHKIGVPARVANPLDIRTFDNFSAACLARLEPTGMIQYRTPEQLRPHVLRAIGRAQESTEERHPEELLFEGTGEARVEGLLRAFALLKGTLRLRMDAHESRLTPQLAEDLGFDYATLRIFRSFETLRRGVHPDRPEFRAPGDATYDLALLVLDEDFGLETAQEVLGRELGLVVLDEMHDTNRAMFSVLAKLMECNPRAAFVGVGDRDQVIHSSAGADAAFMGEAFRTGIGPFRRLPLTASYRFGKRLAAVAGALANKPYQSRATGETEVTVVACDGGKSMCSGLVEFIRRARARPGKEGDAWPAVLIRHAHQSIDIENRFLNDGIDYRTAGFRSYLHRPEILLVRGLVAHARGEFEAFESEETRAAVLRALFLFSASHVDSAELAHLGQAEVQRRTIAEVARAPAGARAFIENHVLRNAAPEVRQSFLAALAIAKQDDARAFAEQFAAALSPARLARRVLVNEDDVASVEANVVRLMRSALDTTDVGSFFRVTNAWDARLARMDGRSGVVLSSIEAAKGLEFDDVFLPGMNRGEFASDGDSVESRNMLYVGMTRARRSLTIFFDADRPSRYLVDLGLLADIAAAAPAR